MEAARAGRLPGWSAFGLELRRRGQMVPLTPARRGRCPAPGLDPTPRPGRHIAAGGRVAPGAPAAAGCRRRHPAAHFKFERLRKGMECWPVFSAAIW